MGFDGELGSSSEIAILMIAIVDPILYDSNAQGYFAILLIASFRKTHNSQSLESRNQNLTYSIMCAHV